jgi:fumarate reductase subunit D
MAVRQHSEPYLWLLFSAGGVISAMLMPAMVLILGIAIPLGWVAAPTREGMQALLGNPIVGLALFGLCFLSLFHAAHRLRHTLHDALGIKGGFVAALCYGAAAFGSVMAAYLLWQVG